MNFHLHFFGDLPLQEEESDEESEEEDEDDDNSRDRFKSERGSTIISLSSSRTMDIPDKLGQPITMLFIACCHCYVCSHNLNFLCLQRSPKKMRRR